MTNIFRYVMELELEVRDMNTYEQRTLSQDVRCFYEVMFSVSKKQRFKTCIIYISQISVVLLKGIYQWMSFVSI